MGLNTFKVSGDYQPQTGQLPFDERMQKLARTWEATYHPFGATKGYMAVNDSPLGHTLLGFINDLRSAGCHSEGYCLPNDSELPAPSERYSLQPRVNEAIYSHHVRDAIGKSGLFIPDGPAAGGEVRLYDNMLRGNADILDKLSQLGVLTALVPPTKSPAPTGGEIETDEQSAMATTEVDESLAGDSPVAAAPEKAATA